MKIKRSKWKRPVREIAPCIRCGEREAHFVPPSLGELGFYVCEDPLFRLVEGAKSKSQRKRLKAQFGICK